MPKIALSAAPIEKNPVGLGVYTKALIPMMLEKGDSFDFTVYANTDLLNELPEGIVSPVSKWTSSDLGYRGHIMRMLWYQAILPLKLRSDKADLFYSPVHEGMLFPRTRQVITVHDIIPVKFPEIHPIGKYYYRYVLPILLRNSAAIVCVSEYSKKDLLLHYNCIEQGKVHVIYNGYRKDLFYPCRQKIKSKYGLSDYFLYVGDMRSYKNLVRIFRAFARIKSKDMALAICGRKDHIWYPQLKRQVERLGIENRVAFLDYVCQEDLRSLYSEAVALVFASLYEGFGMPALEAMACECPVITSNATSLPEVCGDAAYYVDPNSLDEIERGMELLMCDSGFRDELRHKGLIRAKMFSWEKSARQHMDLFKKILAE